MSQFYYFDVVCAISSVIGFYYIGKKKWFGWLINLCGQVFWISLAVMMKSVAFFVTSILFSFIFAYNLFIWYRSER